MKITDVRGFALSSPIRPPQTRRFHGGKRRLLKRDIVIVLIDTKDGRRGVSTAGASSSAMTEFFEGDSQATLADIINGPVANALIGCNIESISDAHGELHQVDLPESGRIEAHSAIDIALYDLMSQSCGEPVYRLLADRFKTTPTTSLDLYASAGMYMEPAGYQKQAKVIESLGFFGYKYRPGIGPAKDRQTISLLADALSSSEFMLDCHTWWKIKRAYEPETVRDLVSYAHERGAYWIEEPVAPTNYSGYRRLARTGAAIAGGESEPDADGLCALGETGAVSFLQGDVRHHGGFSGCAKAVDLCATEPGVQFVPHNFGTWIGLVANAHLVAAAPNTTLVEYPVFMNDPVLNGQPDPGMYPFDLAFDLVTEPPQIEDGILSLSNDPGLGVTFDIEVLDEYPFIDGPWTEFHYDQEPA